MSPFNETSHPLIEITLSRKVLRRCLVVVPLGLLLLLGVIGAAVSPLVDGHPLILTRERLALKHYLEETQGWTQRLNQIAARLDTLSPKSLTATNSVGTSTSAISITRMPTGSLPSQVDLPSQVPLSAFNAPVSQPTNLFDRAHAAEQVAQELLALERDLQRIETPAALTGLHELSAETVQAFVAWSSQVIDAIGAPTSETIAAVQVSRQTALITLETLHQTLAQQQGIQP